MENLLEKLDIASYDEYISQYENATRPDVNIKVAGSDYSARRDMEADVLKSFDGAMESAVKTGETGSISWNVEIPEDGLYSIGIRYLPTEGNASSIEREIKIDGETPFDEASRIVLSRLWENESEDKKFDKKGNELRPRQVEKPEWREVALFDSEGYHNGAFLFYFSKGKHEIELVSHREPVIIDYIKIYNEAQLPDYQEMKQLYQSKGYKESEGKFISFQGENAILKSNPSLYPISDRTSPTTEPYHPGKTRLNTIGGQHWKVSGQWITWEFDVPEDGLYEMGTKYKQNFVQGNDVVRLLHIDGEVPFKEAQEIHFKHGDKWQINMVGKKDEPYLFYFTKGRHRLTLEVSMGGLTQIVQRVRFGINELNELYRQIIMVTGTQPDPYRDYRLERQIDNLEERLEEQGNLLNKVADKMDALAGGTSDKSTILRTTAYQLKDLAKHPETVPKRLEQFRDNAMSLGTWLLEVNEAPLEIDYLFLKSKNVQPPKATATLWNQLKHDILSFAYTFGDGYTSLSDTKGSDKEVTVWLGTGRDQAQIIESMIESLFTPQAGIDVNLQLISQDALLPATLSGKGPDVAISVPNVIEFAMRNALVDLTQYPDFDEVHDRFMPSAFEGFKFRSGIYAIPEKQPFPMLFYRQDVLDELHLQVPNTWDDLYYIIPELQKHNVQVGMTPNLVFEMLLYQNGGQYYQGDGIAVDIDSPVGIEAFKKWTELYTNYKLPREFDFVNRFRTGEMPLGIADYNIYNTLAISAPEIRGQWGFAPVPGVLREDGKVHRDVIAKSDGTIMLKNAKNKAAAWKFIKWWTDTEAQVNFGREMEAIQGESSRYAAANVKAFTQLPWPAKDYGLLMEQWKWVKGMPEVPGGYSLTRHLENAFFEVYNDGSDPRETLAEYVDTINNEITVKREEFDLPTKK